jgi:uncharacterized damage-inducible protein DinB
MGDTLTTDTVKLLARYNLHANTEMGLILSELSEAEWNRGLGGYFPSIRSIASHLFEGDFHWLQRFATLRPFPYAQHPIFEQNVGWGDLRFPTFREYETMRKLLDEQFAAFAEEVRSADFSRRLRYKNWKNIEQDREFGGLILHVFNHQTHHRGMIALYLDLLGKANDFSNVIPLV